MKWFLHAGWDTAAWERDIPAWKGGQGLGKGGGSRGMPVMEDEGPAGQAGDIWQGLEEKISKGTLLSRSVVGISHPKYAWWWWWLFQSVVFF